MLLLAWLILTVVSVVLARGRLLRLAEVEVERPWTLLVSLGVQVVIISVVPGAPKGVLSAAHVVSYLLAGLFVLSNRRTPGVLLIGLGGLSNLAAIAANGGVMPAARSAAASAGVAEVTGHFANSAAVAKANLAFLGDVFAIPSSWPLHNVFSVGDVCIALGAAIALHTICGSRLVPSGRGEFRSLLGYPDFLRLWAAQAVSNLGDWVYSLAVAVSLTEKAGTSSALAFLLMAQVGPAVFAGLFGGPLIDRFPRKAVMIVSDLLRAAGVASLLAVGRPEMAHLLAVAACLGIFEAIFQPSLQASLPNLVPRERIVAANALVAATFHLAVMAGPILGGVLVAGFGLGPALALNAASFLLSAVLVAGVRMPRMPIARRGSNARQDLVEGIRYSLRTPLVRGVFIVTGGVMFAAALKSPLEPLFVLRSLGQEPAGLGLTGGVWGLGMLLGSIAAPAAARAWSRERLLSAGIAVVGFAVLFASQAAALATVLLLWLVSGVGNALGSVSYESLLQERTPDPVRGRVMAAADAVMNATYLAGVSLAGWLGDNAGIRPAYAISGALFLGMSLVSRVLLREQPVPAHYAAKVPVGSERALTRPLWTGASGTDEVFPSGRPAAGVSGLERHYV